MNELQKMFEYWRKFLEGTILTEAISDDSLKHDTTNARTFINFFVRSRETAMIALQMIQISLDTSVTLYMFSPCQVHINDNTKKLSAVTLFIAACK